MQSIVYINKFMFFIKRIVNSEQAALAVEFIGVVLRRLISRKACDSQTYQGGEFKP
jgi:hypothetical protein